MVSIVRKPTVVGISSLGLDHVSLLGDTVEQIAVHKTGIMKPSVPTFTVDDQPGESLKVIARKALEVEVGEVKQYYWYWYSIEIKSFARSVLFSSLHSLRLINGALISLNLVCRGKFSGKTLL